MTVKKTVRAARYLWRAHAALLFLVAAFTLVSAIDNPPDANIGLGLGLFALGGLGAPWSLPVLLDDQMMLDSWVYVGVATVTAILNLLIHAGLVRWWTNRSA